MARACADVGSLRSACVKNGKMRESSSMNLFNQGFNQRQALFDLSTSVKVRRQLTINFGVRSINSGYASFLGKFAGNNSVLDRITLLHGEVIHPRIAELVYEDSATQISLRATQDPYYP